MRPVLRVDEALVLRLDRSHRPGGVGRSDLLEATAHRVAAGEVQVDLDGAAGPAGLGLADGLARRRPAVGGLRLGQEAHLDQRLAPVDREKLRRKAVVRRDERRRILAHQLAGAGQDLVRLLVGRADEALAGRDAAVGLAVQVDVVVGRVRRAAGQLRRDETEELMLELVGRRHARQQQVRLVRLDDVLEHRQVPGLPVQPLLGVGLLRRDAGLEDREVGGGRRRELLREVLGEVAAEARLAGPARPRRDCATDRRVEEPDA